VDHNAKLTEGESKMKRILTHVPALVVLVMVAVSGLEPTATAGKPPTDTPVTTTIDGLGVDTLPTLRVQSDQLGAYKNSSSLSSIIQAIGDWELDMLNFKSSPQRKALIDLRDPVAGSGPNGGAPINPFGASGYQIVRARFISKCSQNGINFLNMQPNSIYPCPLALAFDDASGVRYRLAENPINFSETNWLQVTCVATGANAKCNQWKIEPSATQLNGEVKNVAKLLKVATKPRETDQDLGDFYLSFTIHVTNP
jgi:hypothetical protein